MKNSLTGWKVFLSNQWGAAQKNWGEFEKVYESIFAFTCL